MLRSLGRFVMRLWRAVRAHPEVVDVAEYFDPRLLPIAQIAVSMAGALERTGPGKHARADRTIREMAKREAIELSDSAVNLAIELAVARLKASRAERAQ